MGTGLVGKSVVKVLLDVPNNRTYLQPTIFFIALYIIRNKEIMFN